MTVFTHTEWLKTEGRPPQQVVPVKKFVDSSNLFRFVPFENITGPASFMLRQASLPAINKRAVGEEYAHTEGRLDPGVEMLKIMGGLHKFDKFQVDTGQGSRRAFEIEAFMEAIALGFDYDFIWGSTTTDPRDFDGLFQRATAAQTVLADPAGGTVNPISVRQSQATKRKVSRPTHWVMAEVLQDRLTEMAMNPALSGYIRRGANEMGEEIIAWCGLPIIPVRQDALDQDILDFTEAVTAGGSDGMSAYCVSLRQDRLHGIQTKPPEFRDLGLLDNGTQVGGLTEWYASIKEEHPKSIARIRDIADATPTVVPS